MAESDSVASVSPARYPAPFSGAVAQLGERLGRIEEVASSTLVRSISPCFRSSHEPCSATSQGGFGPCAGS